MGRAVAAADLSGVPAGWVGCLPIWGVGRPPKLLHMGSRLSEALMTESTSFTQLQDLSATFVRLVETAAAGIVAI